jgi:hypothetical protein
MQTTWVLGVLKLPTALLSSPDQKDDVRDYRLLGK